VFEPGLRRVADAVEDEFGFAETSVVAFEDLYAGKLSAALDRQHPRDFFDVSLLYENEGLTDDLFRVFLVYVASSRRPVHELLNPSFQPLQGVFEREFEGMSNLPVTVADLEAARERLVKDIQDRLTGPVASFLRTLGDAAPDFSLINLEAAENLPAVQWKVINLQKLRTDNVEKFEFQKASLEALLL